MCVDIMSHLCMCFKVTTSIILRHMSLKGESENTVQMSKIKNVTVASTLATGNSVPAAGLDWVQRFILFSTHKLAATIGKMLGLCSYIPHGADGWLSLEMKAALRLQGVAGEQDVLPEIFTDTYLKHAGEDRTQNYRMLMTNAHMCIWRVFDILDANSIMSPEGTNKAEVHKTSSEEGHLRNSRCPLVSCTLLQ